MRPRAEEIDALLAQAEAGGPGAAAAARRAATLADGADPRRARAALKLAITLEPLDSRHRLALARIYGEAGDLASARREAATVFEQAVDQAARARAAFMLGELARASGELETARQAYSATLTIEDKLLAQDRLDPHAARWYARARGRLAELDAHGGRQAEARTGAEGALAMLRAAAVQTSETQELAADIADAEVRLANMDLDQAQWGAARRRLGEAIGRYEALVLQEPNEPHWRAVLADAWMMLAEAELMGGVGEGARAAIDKAMTLRLKLARDDARERWALAGAWRMGAALRAHLGDHTGAANALSQARTLAEALCAESGNAEAPARFLTHTLLNQAEHALAIGDQGRAREAADAARRIGEAFANAPDADPGWIGDAASAWDRLADALGVSNAGLEALARAVAFRRMAQNARPHEPRLADQFGAALAKLGQAALRARNLRSARSAFSQHASFRLSRAEAAPGDARAAYALAVALEELGAAAAADGDFDAARNAWESEAELAERLFADEAAPDAQRFRAILETHLAGLGGPDADGWRARALTRLDWIDAQGLTTTRDEALRAKLQRPPPL